MPRRLPVAAIVIQSLGLMLGLHCESAAQTAYTYSPVELYSAEGRGSCSYLGAYPNMRYQMVDGDQLGATKTIKELAFRLDDRNYYSVVGMGRSFAKLSLHMANADYASFGKDFSSNLKSTPTLVFSKAVRWPTLTGFPLLRPAKWGGLTDNYRLPFAQTYTTDPKQSFLADFRFSGGTLANRGAWSSATFRGYAFDSYGPPITSVDGTYRSIPALRLHNTSSGVTGRCNDTAFGSVASGSYGKIFATLYGPTYRKLAWRNKLVLYSTSHFTAFQSPVIHVWGLVTDPVGVDYLTGCNRLHAIGPYVAFNYLTAPRSVDPTGYSGFQYSVVPWFAGLAQLRLVMQAGWADSASNKLNLTQAREVTLPSALPSGVVPKRAALLQYGTAAVVGPIGEFSHNPGIRYGH